MRDPIFIVAPPRSGGRLLAEAFTRSPRIRVAPGAIDDAITVHCGACDRLTAADATPQIIDALRNEVATLAGESRLLDASTCHALRVPFLHKVFPEATFVYIYREPRRAIHDLPESSGVSPEDLAHRWNAMTSQLLDDLEKLPPSSWMIAAYHALAERPDLLCARVADFLGISWDGTLPPMPAAAEKPPAETVEKLDAVDAITRKTADRARDLFAATPPRARGPESFRSVATQTLPAILQRLGISLAVSTYQSGRLILVRAEDETTLNTHFRMFDSPMGIAVGKGRMAIGTARHVYDYRNIPAVAAKIQPLGKHDACFIPRNIHITGDIRIHEIGYAAGELWIVNTRFSALCTVDAESSFVPRWRPPFITQLAPEDRCHLNGMAIVDDRVRYVTALGATNTAGGWRANKAKGGLLLDVDSGETLLQGLCMPHSPRVAGGRFYLLESGKGSLATVDLASRKVDTIAELPGFTRGLAFAGPFAFVGLSQVRESNIFGDLPLTDRVAERQCGVYVVDLRNGEIAAFLRFEGDVQEIFDVQVLPMRFPDLLETTDPLVATSYAVPDEMLGEFA